MRSLCSNFLVIRPVIMLEMSCIAVCADCVALETIDVMVFSMVSGSE